MLQSFCEIIIWTADMPRATAFYRDILGMQVIEAGNKWSTFAPPDAAPDATPILGVMATTNGEPVPFTMPGSNGAQQGAIFSFTVRNLIEAISKLEARGLNVTGSMYDDPAWGRCVMYRDPDRNTFMLVERYAPSA